MIYHKSPNKCNWPFQSSYWAFVWSQIKHFGHFNQAFRKSFGETKKLYPPKYCYSDKKNIKKRHSSEKTIKNCPNDVQTVASKKTPK
jgi:hypothetical protein